MEQITKQENAIRYRVGDQYLTRAEVTDLLAHNPDRNLREQAWRATSQLAAANGKRIQDAIKLRNQLAGKYSSELFSSFVLQRKGLEVQQLFEWFEQIREQTELAYQGLLLRMRRELNVSKIEPWDLEFYFSNFTNEFESQKFSTDDGWTKVKQLTATFGYNLVPVEMHVADLSFAGAAYPVLYGKEVKLLANRYSGIYFYDRLLHATGHALHYQMIKEPSFLLRNNYAEPADEGMAQLMTLMLYRPEINKGLFGLTPTQASTIEATYRLKMLYNVRNAIADSLAEFDAYADTDQDPPLSTTASMQNTWVSICMRPQFGLLTRCMVPIPLYLQSFVVGEMVAHQIQNRTDQKFGRRWGETSRRIPKRQLLLSGSQS